MDRFKNCMTVRQPLLFSWHEEDIPTPSVPCLYSSEPGDRNAASRTQPSVETATVSWRLSDGRPSPGPRCFEANSEH